MTYIYVLVFYFSFLFITGNRFKIDPVQLFTLTVSLTTYIIYNPVWGGDASTISNISSTDLALCPSGWLTSLTSRSCILPYKKFKSWDEARVWCKADAGDLLIKVDKEKLNLLYGNFLL